MKRYILVALSIMMLFVTGCGKFGEDKTVNFIKKNLINPNSFEKISYDVDEKSLVSCITFEAKNQMNATIRKTIYVNLKGDNPSTITMKGVSSEVAEKLFKTKTGDFLNVLDIYKKLDTQSKLVKKAIAENQNIFKQTNPDMNDDFNTLHFARSRYMKYAEVAERNNKIIYDYKMLYDDAHSVLKELFEKQETQYLLVTTNLSVYKNSRTEYTKDMQEQIFTNSNGQRVNKNNVRIDGVDDLAPIKGEKLLGTYVGTYNVDGQKKNAVLEIYKENNLYMGKMKFSKSRDFDNDPSAGSFICHLGYGDFKKNIRWGGYETISDVYIMTAYRWLKKTKDYSFLESVNFYGSIDGGVFKGETYYLFRKGSFELKKQ